MGAQEAGSVGIDYGGLQHRIAHGLAARKFCQLLKQSALYMPLRHAIASGPSGGSLIDGFKSARDAGDEASTSGDEECTSNNQGMQVRHSGMQVRHSGMEFKRIRAHIR